MICCPIVYPVFLFLYSSLITLSIPLFHLLFTYVYFSIFLWYDLLHFSLIISLSSFLYSSPDKPLSILLLPLLFTYKFLFLYFLFIRSIALWPNFSPVVLFIYSSPVSLFLFLYFTYYSPLSIYFSIFPWYDLLNFSLFFPSLPFPLFFISNPLSIPLLPLLIQRPAVSSLISLFSFNTIYWILA